ncbi:transposase [Streptomyces sp. NBC_01224]|uniref:hypothetical protein n=1 Tax=Streptomyces sp. NBC_01224 TaxID=2903783 RepID=UPI002E158362|nr:transposase [Streptomyces sp. NBC_01224]
MSRRAKGSRNRNKQRIKVVKAHTKVADARRGFHHKLSVKPMRENQAVGVERPSPDRRPCEPLGLHSSRRLHRDGSGRKRCSRRATGVGAGAGSPVPGPSPPGPSPPRPELSARPPLPAPCRTACAVVRIRKPSTPGGRSCRPRNRS